MASIGVRVDIPTGTKHNIQIEKRADTALYLNVNYNAIPSTTHIRDVDDFIVTDKSPIEPDQDILRHIVKHNIKIGQLKLLVTNLMFITRYWCTAHKTPVFLYIGASPGYGLVEVMTLYPMFRYILYDPCDICEKLKTFLANRPDIVCVIYNKLFGATEYNIVREFAGTNPIYYNCDIRSRDFSKTLDTQYDMINDDMRMQIEWAKNLNVYMAMLKFAVIPQNSEYEYPPGTLYFQPYTGERTGEFRLVIPNANLKLFVKWDMVILDQKLRYLNCYVRNNCIFRNFRTNTITALPGGLPAVYDNMYTYKIVDEYMTKIEKDDDQLRNEIFAYIIRDYKELIMA